MTTVDDILSHHGVRGQRWGVRRSRSELASSGPAEVIVRAAPGKKIRTSGGTGHPPHEDAVKAAAAIQKAKASRVHSLSNQEIQAAVARMSLESKYSEAIRKQNQKGVKGVIKNILGKSASKEFAALAKGDRGPVLKVIDQALAPKVVGSHRK